MTPVLPRFRSRPHRERATDARRHGVRRQGPGHEEFYSARGDERFISEQCDGATPAEVVRRRTGRNSGRRSSEALEQFLRSLGAAGAGIPAPRHEARTRGGGSGPGATCSTSAFRCATPDRLIGGLVRRIAFSSTPAFSPFRRAHPLRHRDHDQQLGRRAGGARSALPLLGDPADLGHDLGGHGGARVAHGLTCSTSAARSTRMASCSSISSPPPTAT